MNRLIREHEIYKGRICRFTHNEVEFEDGSTGYRDILHLPGAVAVLAKDNDGKILFVEQFRHAINDYLLALQAGMLEKGEDPREAALRELQEETGYKADNIFLLTDFYTSPGVVNEKIYIYGATDLTFIHQDLDEEEFIEVKRFSEDEVRRMIDEGILKDGKSIVGFELFTRRQNNK